MTGFASANNDIRFRCECGKALKVPETAAGKTARCPACGRMTPVPQRGQAAPASEPAVPRRPRTGRAVGGRRRRFPVAAVAAVVTVGVLGGVAWAFLPQVLGRNPRSDRQAARTSAVVPEKEAEEAIGAKEEAGAAGTASPSLAREAEPKREDAGPARSARPPLAKKAEPEKERRAVVPAEKKEPEEKRDVRRETTVSQEAGAPPAPARVRPPSGEIRSAFEKRRFDEKELLKHDYVSLMSQPAVFTLHRAPRATEFSLFRVDKAAKNFFGAPTVMYVSTASGVKALEPGASIKGGMLNRPWVVVSFSGGEASFDLPILIVLAKRPSEIVWSDPVSIVAKYDPADTGWIARMPLYGYRKLQQPGQPNWFKENGLPDKGPHTWEWKGRFPASAAKRCDWWSRVCRAFPVGYMETFSVDRGKDTVTTREEFEWFYVKDDWNTRPLAVAAIPPTLAFTRQYPGFPIEFSSKIQDLDYYTLYGPYMGALNVNKLEYTIPVGKYVNSVLELDRDKLTGQTDRAALANIQTAMGNQFRDPSVWHFPFWGINLVWEFHADSWFARALPLVSDELREGAEGAWRLFMRHFALREWENGWSVHRGRWVLHGPGSHAWGGFGDSGKLGSTTLITVWAYAHFANDWDFVKERWDFIRKMYNTDLVCDGWPIFCRHSHAEWGDIGPPSIALARMAWKVGDVDTYNYATFLAGRQLVGHFATLWGGQYFRENGPHRYAEKTPETVFPSWQGHGSGWFVNGPGFVPKGQPREEQWDNRFVRFACPDLGRFYRDALDGRMRRFLTNPAVLNQKRMKGMANKDGHIRPSFLRLWGLATNADQETVAKKGPWRNWKHGHGAVAGNYALLAANRDARRLVRVVPPGPPTGFIVGLERTRTTASLGAGLVDGWWGCYTSGWFLAHRTYMPIGSTGPVAGEDRAAYGGSRILNWAGLARWQDHVPKRNLDGGGAGRLNQQFNSKWMVCGPFTIGLDDSIEKKFPPEREIRLSASYTEDVAGRWEGPVRWREVEARNGAVDSQKAFGGTWRMGYHLQYIRSPEERKATLAVGHNGGCKAWLNDEEVFYAHKRHHNYNGKSPSKIAVTLKRGWNKLLIKTEGMWGKWQTSGHILAPDGYPFDDLRYSARPVR